jgi:hypothetical protein
MTRQNKLQCGPFRPHSAQTFPVSGNSPLDCRYDVGEARDCHIAEFPRFDRYARPAPGGLLLFWLLLQKVEVAGQLAVNRAALNPVSKWMRTSCCMASLSPAEILMFRQCGMAPGAAGQQLLLPAAQRIAGFSYDFGRFGVGYKYFAKSSRWRLRGRGDRRASRVGL